MIIKSLKLQNFRNYEYQELNFDKGTNILYGDNAQGKTNILEAIYVATTTKSHRTTNDKEFIKFGNEEAHINLKVEKSEIDYSIDIHIKNGKNKNLAIDKIPLKKAKDLFGLINIVFFSPEDLNIIKNGPSERRRFIDIELSQLDKIYLSSLIEYNKVLNHRNKLLKELSFKKDNIETLDIWDLQLVKYGKEIIRKRADFIEKLNKIIYDIQLSLTSNEESLILKYDKNIEENLFLDKLRNLRDHDILMKNTGIGPHRDDLAFIIKKKDKEIDARKFASQGQQRTIALSLKLAEIEIVKLITKEYPILLLDDVLSELDSKRQNSLLKIINKIQTIITCTGMDDFTSLNMKVDKSFKIIDGRVKEEF